MPPREDQGQSQPQPAAARPESREDRLKDAPDLPYALRLRKAEQEHGEEVRAAADAVDPPMPEPVDPEPGYVSEAKAEEDKLLAKQEEQRQKMGAAAAGRQDAIAKARNDVRKAEQEARKAEHEALREARRAEREAAR